MNCIFYLSTLRNRVILSLTTFLFLSILSFQNLAAQTYCASKGIAPWDVWITKVDFNTISNASEKFKDYATLGYSDYTNVSTTVNKGQSYPLSITPPLGWTGYFSNVYCRVWIDYNGNKIFEDNEKVVEGTNITLFSQNVLIPTTAVSGNARMRVAIKWGSYPTACEMFDKGEVEDYTINIQAGNDLCSNDVTPPVLSNCPQNMVGNEFGPSCHTFSWVSPTATDNCSGTPTVSFIFKKNSTILSRDGLTVVAQICPPVDTVIYTAIDAKGNFSTCQFELKVVNQCQIPQVGDTLPPDIVLTTTGNCMPYKWVAPSYTLGCNFGPAPTIYNPYPLVSSVPNVNVVRIPPTCQNCFRGTQDSACFPIGTTVLTYDVYGCKSKLRTKYVI